MHFYIDERILAVIGLVLIGVGFLMGIVGVGVAVFAIVPGAPGIIATFFAVILTALLPVIFIKDPFFWIVWIIVVALCAVPLYGWWSLIILGGIISAIVLIYVAN